MTSRHLLQSWQQNESFTSSEHKLYIIHITAAPWPRVVSENHSVCHPAVTWHSQLQHISPSSSPSAASRWLSSLILRSCLQQELSPEAEVAAVKAPQAMKEQREKHPDGKTKKKTKQKVNGHDVSFCYCGGFPAERLLATCCCSQAASPMATAERCTF